MLGVIAFENAFKSQGKSKTLKTEIKDGITIEHAVNAAYHYVSSANPEGYTRIEFKYDNCWIIVARLKGE